MAEPSSPLDERVRNGGPFRLDAASDLSPIRDALAAAGITEPRVADTVDSGPFSQSFDMVAALWQTREPTPFNTLVRLFVLAKAVSEEAARAALAPAALEWVERTGLLRRTPEGVRSVAALIPFDELALARDFWAMFVDEPQTADYVLGVGPASLTAGRMTVRRQVDTALDLGTGCGYLALLAARHARRVVATDVNPRALNVAAFNARLNGVRNVEWRLGSLFEPVADERFGLIVSNPPFAITPEMTYQYRDGDRPGDSFSEQVVRGAPAHLVEGGFCTILVNWHHQSDDDWEERPRRWVEGNGCDVWLIKTGTELPLHYAISWLRVEHAGDPAGYDAAIGRWLHYYEQLGAERLSLGILVMRRRAGENWFRSDTVASDRPQSPCSDQILRVFGAEDLLRSLGDDRELLGARFRLTAGHELMHRMHAEAGRWNVDVARLKQTRGFDFTGNVDRLVGTVVAGCDGTRTLREMAAELAEGLGVDFEKAASPCIGVMRTLLRAGFFELAD